MARYHVLVEKLVLVVKRCVGLRDRVAFFDVRREVDDLVAYLALADLAVGRFDEVLTLADEILNDEYANNELMIRASALNFKGFVARDRGEFANARQWLSESMALDAANGWAFGEVRALLALAKTDLADDRLSSAAALLAQAEDRLASAALPAFDYQLIRYKAALQWREGDQDTAIATLLEGIDATQASSSEKAQGDIAAELVNFYLQLNDLTNAETWMGVAKEKAPRAPMTKLTEAKLAIHKGQDELARSLLLDLRETNGEHYAVEVTQLLVGLGSS